MSQPGTPAEDKAIERRPDWKAFTPPDGVEKLSEEWVARLVPERPLRGHKGTFGTLLCVCGSLDYLGAAFLVGHAALRSGAGLVTLAMPRSVQALAAGRVIEATTLGLPETAPGEVDPEAAAELIEGREATGLLVGSGMRAGEPTRNLVTKLIAADGPAAVLDAEALNSLAVTDGWSQTVRRPIVVTPHPGEFKRLDGTEVGDDNAERAERARTASERWGLVVVLKGANTVVAAPDGRLRMAPFQNPAMATGGTGDVLAGILGSLLSQHVEPFEAACLAVWLHGIAGEHVRERIGEAGLLSGELPWEVPRIRRHLAELGRHAAQGTPRVGFAPRNS
jgi:NAD(P)H-hydrate epimerase